MLVRNTVPLFLFLFLALYTKVVLAADRPLPAIPNEPSLIRGLQAIEQGRWSVGQSILTEARGSLPAEAFYWLKYTNNKSSVSYDRVTRFIRSHKNWPLLSQMQQTAEEAMPTSLSSQDVVRWFDEFPPVTNQGYERYIDALLNVARPKNAAAQAKEWWTERVASADLQRRFYQKYKGLLSVEDHKKRLALLMAREYYTPAKNLSLVMPEGYAALAEAEIALAQGNGNVDTLIARVPKSLQNDPGLLYERLKWRRNKNLNSGMEEILARQPKMSEVHDPNAWWHERHILIRRYMDDKQYSKAYRLAAANGQNDGGPLADAEFLAGWLALNFMNQPAVAFPHFKRLYENVSTPISKARGAYWAGLSSERGGNQQVAEQWYKTAARYRPAFYGALAAKKIGQSVSATPENLVTAATWQKWSSDTRLRMAILFFKAGFTNESRAFFINMAMDDNLSESDYATLAQMADQLGDTMAAVKVYKKAAQQGHPLSGYGYPVRTFKTLSGLPAHIVHAIIRQESEFNPQALSHANAHGLMQLLPSTASRTAKSIGKPFNKDWLRNRPEYNVELGSAYLASLLRDYNGAIPLAAAAYNAGPSRVKSWIALYGDPRTGQIDPLDWMEQIPFAETRNYVQRVLEGYMAYDGLISTDKTSAVPLKTLL